ncbi:MAG: DUF2764 domain-containing protein [Bacteroidales bacterium]|nr:DUF2764 domain-containing protein [Bacteroidales bacterium]
MLKTNYFCLIAGLPDIIIPETKSLVSCQEFKLELSEQLKPDDYKLAEMLYFKYDNENLLNIIHKKNEPFNLLGKYTQEELEEQIEEPTYIVDYLKQFITEFKTEKTQVPDFNRENKLQTLFFDFVMQTKNEFLKKWFEFDMNIKNILTAINCRKYNYNIKNQLIKIKSGNEVYENLIKEIPKPDLLSDQVIYAEQVLKIAESDESLTRKENATDMLKLKFLEEFTFFKYFNIEKILAFIIVLNIAERWLQFDNKTGKNKFNFQLLIDNIMIYK